jgi:hypothetical protein
MRLGLPIDVNDASLLTTAASSHCLPAVEHMLVRGTFTAEDIATAVEYSLDDNEEITFNTDVVRSLMRYAARFDTYPQLVEDALGFALRTCLRWVQRRASINTVAAQPPTTARAWWRCCWPRTQSVWESSGRRCSPG